MFSLSSATFQGMACEHIAAVDVIVVVVALDDDEKLLEEAANPCCRMT